MASEEHHFSLIQQSFDCGHAASQHESSEEHPAKSGYCGACPSMPPDCQPEVVCSRCFDHPQRMKMSRPCKQLH